METKSKRHALALLTGILAVALTVAACGGSDDDSTTSSAAAPATSAAAPAATDATSTGAPAASAPDPTSGKDIKLGFVQLFNEPYALQIAAGIKAAADEYGASVKVTGPDSLDPTGAISNFQNVVASGAQGILAMAYPEELWKSRSRPPSARTSSSARSTSRPSRAARPRTPARPASRWARPWRTSSPSCSRQTRPVTSSPASASPAWRS